MPAKNRVSSKNPPEENCRNFPVAAHIHKAKPSRPGPVVVPLTQPSGGDPGASSGCVTIDTALARAILKHPHRYYANVHTMAFPGGAARGQLFRRSN